MSKENYPDSTEGKNFNNNENSIDKNKLVEAVNDLADKFVSFDDDAVISAAVESDDFKNALIEMSKTNPEKLIEIKAKLEAYLKQRDNILLLEDELSKNTSQSPIGEFDFKTERQKLIEDGQALDFANKIESFFKHPVVSYFTNLLVPPKERKELANTYQGTVDEIKDRMKKNKEEGLTQSALVLLPIIKAINAEKREEIKKEFFGAKSMREALMRGADIMIDKELDKGGEDYAREIFGDNVFDNQDFDKMHTTPEETTQEIEKEAERYMKESIRVTLQYHEGAEQKAIDEVKRIMTEAINQGLDIDTVKETTEKYIADLAMDLNFNHAKNILAFKVINMVRNYQNK